MDKKIKEEIKENVILIGGLKEEQKNILFAVAMCFESANNMENIKAS